MKSADMFKKKNILITGASNGIGREFAFLFARAGAHLILTGRNISRLEALRQEIERLYPASCSVFSADLSFLDQAKSLALHIERAGLSVDVLVNNAGFATYGYFHKLDIAGEINELCVNVVSVVYLTHYFLQGMVQRGQGWILNISSTAALLPSSAFEAVYGSTKAFLAHFSLSLAEEYRSKNIFVACLLPGNTDTDFWERGHLKRKFSSGRKSMMSPKQVAERGIAMLLAGKTLATADRKTAWKAWLVKFLPSCVISRLVYRKHYDSILEEDGV